MVKILWRVLKFFKGLLLACRYTSDVLADSLRWHQDVKPDNILVISNNVDSPYDWKFVLSDLGLSHFKRTTQHGSDIDAYGTETYGKLSGNIEFCSI